MAKIILNGKGVKRIHVNTINVRHNADTGATHPGLIVRNGKAVIYCDRVEIAGPSKLVYTPEKPLETGQTAYITTKAPVVAFGVRYDDDNKDEKRSVKEIESEPRRSGCF